MRTPEVDAMGQTAVEDEDEDEVWRRFLIDSNHPRTSGAVKLATRTFSLVLSRAATELVIESNNDDRVNLLTANDSTVPRRPPCVHVR